MALRKSVLGRPSALLSFSKEITDRSRALKSFELRLLREQCAASGVEKHYLAYMNRMQINQLYPFIAILLIIIYIHCILLLTTLSSAERVFIYDDVAVYIGISMLVILILSFNFCTNLIKRTNWIPYVTSTLAIMLLVAMDISLPIALSPWYNITKPIYYGFIILSIYFFVPIVNNTYPIAMASIVSLGYVVFFKLVVYRWKSDGSENTDYSKTITEALFLAGINVLGLFARLSRELVTRMIFLDKRQCIEEKLLLDAAKDQERNLLLSIIPKQIAHQMEADVKMRIDLMKHAKTLGKAMSISEEVRKLFIEPHDDVTILYADVVNYTHLTTTLDVRTLVGTLNELYVRFDDAAQEFKVLRIQFLGDCYYCVANVSIPNEQHAKACVKLGLRMIQSIREVRDIKRLDIDMRIGVHTGSVLSGVIGANKWQFDIYSKDVDIANRLESTGVPGRVHISRETLQQLDQRFEYEPGTQQARVDPLLRKYQITTFLIISEPVDSQLSRSSMYSRLTATDEVTEDMSSTERMKTMVDFEMGQESIKMPIEGLIVHYKSIFFGERKRLTPLEREVKNFYSNFSWLFMWYKNWRMEVSYMQQGDILHKYSVLVAYIITLCMLTMQVISDQQTLFFWFMVLFGNIFILLILVLVWFKKLWTRLFSTTFQTKPKGNVNLWFFKISEKIQRNYKFRVCVYLTLLILQFCLSLEELLDCDRFKLENEVIEMQAYEDDFNDICFDPWVISQSIVLNLSIAFIFTQVPYVIKWIMALSILTFYLIVAFVINNFFYEHSISSNQYFFPEYAHFLLLLMHLLTSQVIARELEFISRMDHNWKSELREKKDNAKFTNKTISILLSNILPSHIVSIYMKDQLTNELYYEQYDNVAVMFATILNFDSEQVGMRVLNEIICDFDRVLGTYQGMNKIEKIKVAGWTYMAACGLSASNPEAVRPQESRDYLPSDFLLSEDDRSPSFRSSDFELIKEDKSSLGNDVVYSMMCFALDLLRAMRAFNMESRVQSEEKSRTIGALRIGISNGPVMAGVVGLYKPFYDVWGNAVNMASRMDSTGTPNSIQVTEESARILESYHVKCIYRGETYVKGRGNIPTYFVNISEDLDLIRDLEDINLSSSVE